MVKAKKGGSGGLTSGPPSFLSSSKFYWGLLFLALFLAYFQKTPCFTGSWSSPESVQYRKLCYSDLQALYSYRGLNEKKIPYVEQKPFEYPPLIGYQMYFAAFFSSNHVEFFKVNALMNALWAILAFLALIKISGIGPHLLWFAATPPLIAHLNLNWDISTVTALSWAMLFWKREQYFRVGLLIGIGFTGKMFPVFAVPFLALYLFQRKANPELAKGVLGTVVGAIGMNLPIVIVDLIINHDVTSVLGVFGFHAGRTPDFGTFWFWLGEIFQWGSTSREYTKVVDTIFILAMGIYTLVLLYRNYGKSGEIWSLAAAVTALCLALSKVHSPQYSLWMLPFLVVLKGDRIPRIFYLIGDLMVFCFGFWWFAEAPDLRPHIFRTIFIIGVFIRAISLFWLALDWGLVPSKQTSLASNSSKLPGNSRKK